MPLGILKGAHVSIQAASLQSRSPVSHATVPVGRRVPWHRNVHALSCAMHTVGSTANAISGGKAHVPLTRYTLSGWLLVSLVRAGVPVML